MNTYFAPPERTPPEELRQEIDTVSHDPAMDGLLRLSGGLLMIVDSHRQIVALNKSLLAELGVEAEDELLGLRPGEALRCVHAREEPAGCGTTPYCSTCGAAVAIVTGLAEGNASTRKCFMAAKRNGKIEELCFLVKATPVEIRSERFVLVYLQDITAHERMAALERAFFHDINNTIMALNGAVELLAMAAPDQVDTNLLDMAKRSLARLTSEVNIQRALVREGPRAYQIHMQKVEAGAMLAELEEAVRAHPAATGKKLEVSGRGNQALFSTDVSLFLRIMGNMLINAFEASGPGDTVRLALRETEDGLVFEVHNPAAIPPEEQLRVFQRHFSTKAGQGRGFGTYSMKLFGEEILGGQVSFTSSPEEGTTFSFRP